MADSHQLLKQFFSRSVMTDVDQMEVFSKRLEADCRKHHKFDLPLDDCKDIKSRMILRKFMQIIRVEEELGRNLPSVKMLLEYLIKSSTHFQDGVQLSLKHISFSSN